MIGYLKTVLLEVCLLIICYLGDNGPQNQSGSQTVRAVSDSLTHGLVGALSWGIVCNIQYKIQDFMECVTSLVLASLVDVDHFLAARSFFLKDAVSLSTRPPFHATTLIFAVDAILCLLLYVFNLAVLKKLILLFSIAWLSHHVRDASRRGLWLYPFGETPPLSRVTYLSVIVCLPLIFRFFHMKWIGSKTMFVFRDSPEAQV